MLLANIRLDSESMPGANIPAYFPRVSVWRRKNTFLLRWPQNATIKEAASETSEARKVEVKLKKEDLEKNGEKSEEVERVGTPEQVRPNFFFSNEKMGLD